MSVLSVQHTATGLSPIWSPASPGGDSYPNTGAETLLVRNQGNVPIIVSVAALNKCNLGALVPLHVVPFTVPAAGLAAMSIGPLPIGFFNDGNGILSFTYSATGPIPAAPALAAGAAGVPSGTYLCAVTFVNAAGESSSGIVAAVTVASQQINWSALALGPAGTSARKLYRILLTATDAAVVSEAAQIVQTAAAQIGAGDAIAETESAVIAQIGAVGALRLVATIADNTTMTFTDNVADSALGAGIPLVNMANTVQVAVTAG